MECVFVVYQHICVVAQRDYQVMAEDRSTWIKPEYVDIYVACGRITEAAVDGTLAL